jgi:hypothetical protein
MPSTLCGVYDLALGKMEFNWRRLHQFHDPILEA